MLLLMPKFPIRDLIALKPILYILSIAGLFSLQPNSNRKGQWIIYVYDAIYNIYFIFIILSTIFLTIFTGMDLFTHLKDVDILLDRGLMFLALVVIMIKQNSFMRNKKIIEYWVGEIQRRYIHANEIEKRHFLENDRITFYYAKLFYCIWFLISVSYILPICFRSSSAQFQLPSIDSAFFGVNSFMKYLFFYIWNSVLLSILIFTVIAIDLFMVGIYSHATSRLQALGDSLENISREDSDCDEHRVMKSSCQFCRSSMMNNDLMQKSITEHCSVIELVGDLNRVFHWTLLVHYIFVAIIVGGCGYTGLDSMQRGNISNFIKSMAYVFGAIWESWMYCYFGDRLKCASLNVSEALWKSHWYKFTKEDRMSVLLIMKASKIPLYMAAGKIFRLDLEHLGFILSSAYSYFTILRNFALST